MAHKANIDLMSPDFFQSMALRIPDKTDRELADWADNLDALVRENSQPEHVAILDKIKAEAHSREGFPYDV